MSGQRDADYEKMLEPGAESGERAMEITAWKFLLKRCGACGDAVEFDDRAGRIAGDFEGLGGERGGGAWEEYCEVEEAKSEAGRHERLPGCGIYLCVLLMEREFFARRASGT